MDAFITSGVHISVKILQPPQAHVHFCHFISSDYCITILLSFVRENRSKPALYNGVNPVLIELSKATQQHDNLGGLIMVFRYHIVII